MVEWGRCVEFQAIMYHTPNPDSRYQCGRRIILKNLEVIVQSQGWHEHVYLIMSASTKSDAWCRKDGISLWNLTLVGES